MEARTPENVSGKTFFSTLDNGAHTPGRLRTPGLAGNGAHTPGGLRTPGLAAPSILSPASRALATADSARFTERLSLLVEKPMRLAEAQLDAASEATSAGSKVFRF